MHKNSYDYKIKQAVVKHRDPRLFEEFGVNPATARNWIYRGFHTPIQIEDIETKALESHKIRKLKEKLAKGEALIDLYREVTSVCEISLQNKHIRDREKRAAILKAIMKASAKSGKMNALSFIGVSLSRYKRWKSPVLKCELSGSDRCHKVYPNQ